MMQIFPKEGLPLLFKSSIGNLGKISIYVKSKEQIDDDNAVVSESDSYDEQQEVAISSKQKGKKK